MSVDYSHLIHIESHEELRLYELLPDVVWIFDLDKHGWWWGNEPALKFWGLDKLEELVNKDLSDDTQGARDRTLQTFELAVKQGLTIDPWTTYPNGKPKTLYMRHRACLVGPEKHRAIIAYVNEEVNLGDTPENLLLVEAMRYTTVLVTSFTFDGDIVVENPAATEAYKHIDTNILSDGQNAFTARFDDPQIGHDLLKEAIDQKGGRWTHMMMTGEGKRKHTLDIRMTRHPLSGDFLILMAEYDVTELHEALETAHQAQEELRRMAHYDALTGVPSLNFLLENAWMFFANAERQCEKVAVLFVDLDGFKAVNDTWGHDAGDRVLIEAGKRLTSAVREADQVSRIGGDEFVLMLGGVKQEEDAAVVARKVVEELSQPIDFVCAERGKLTAQIGASVGVAFYPDHGTDLESLIKVADTSMYDVKHNGKGDFKLAK
jgi:diguanylate cyclase (GGDEF)-like protein